MDFLAPFHNTRYVLLRGFLAWQPYLKNFVLLYMVDPLIFLYAMGIGLGKMMSPDTHFLSFAATGLVAATILWSVSMESSYNTLTRLQGGIWQAMMSTPTPLSSIVFGETVFTATRSLIATTTVFLIGLAWGAIPNPIGYLFALPIIWLASAALGNIIYCVTAVARSHSDFDFIWPLVVSPMFLFSGVFINPESLPTWLHIASYILPLTHAIAAVRPLLMGTAELLPVLTHTAVLAAMYIAATLLAQHLFKKRLCA